MNCFTNIDLMKELIKTNAQHKDVAVATIVRSEGSTPRSDAKMLVFSDGSTLGTVGGGMVEHMAIEDAVKCIKTGHNACIDYDLSSEESNTGMTCGGNMSILIEVFDAKPQLIVCGAGHVALALTDLAQKLGFSVTLLDNREPELIQDKIDMADDFIPVKDFEEDIKSHTFPENAYYVIMTYGHECDLEALAGVLTKPSKYVGMIGSKTKVKGIFEKMQDKGFSYEQLSTVHTPIGLDIGGQTPAEIAVSIMAEIQMVRYERPGVHLCD